MRGAGDANRSHDTRIFNPTETELLGEQAEDQEGLSDWPTEPPRPTEPIPNLNWQFRTSPAFGP
jgi:hypothetical protein